MDSPNNSAEVSQFMGTKQLLEGAVGFLKIVDPIRQTVTKCSGIIINESTVLTLAQKVYDSSRASFYAQIQFTTRNSAEVYHVVESYFINSPDIDQQNQGMTSYAVLKLDKTIDQSSSLCSHFASHNKLKQKSPLQQTTLLLEEQLKKATISISELEEKVKEAHRWLQKANSQLYEAASSQIQRDCIIRASYVYESCLKIEQYLYGKESLQTIGVLERLASTKYQQQPSQSISYYNKIIIICEKYNAKIDWNYANAHFKLGCHFRRKDEKHEAIYHLEEALHIYTEIGYSGQRDCARQLMNVLQKSGMTGCAGEIKQKYRF